MLPVALKKDRLFWRVVLLPLAFGMLSIVGHRALQSDPGWIMALNALALSLALGLMFALARISPETGEHAPMPPAPDPENNTGPGPDDGFDFREIAESLAEVIWVSTPTFDRVLYVNPAYERIWGRSRESIYQAPRSFIDTIHPDDRPRFLEAAEAVRGTGYFFEDYRIIRPDGSIRWVSDRSVPVLDPSGKLRYVAGIARDITDRKQMEEELRSLLSLREQLATVAARVPGMIYTMRVEPDGARSMPYSSPSVESILGFPSDELATNLEGFFATVHPDDVESLRFAFADSARTQNPLHITYRLHHRVRGLRWIESWAQPRNYPDGSREWHGFVMDVTDRHLADEQYRESEERFHLFMKNSPAASWIVDSRGKFLYLSPTYMSMFEVKVDDMKEASIGELFEEKFSADFYANNNRVLELGQPIVVHERAPMSDGTIADLLVYKFLVRGGDDPLVGGVALDVTELNRREEENRNQAFVLENIGQGVNYVDQQGIIKYTNAAFDAMFGYERGELLGRHVSVLNQVEPDARERTSGELFEILNREGKWSGEVRNVRKDGATFLTWGSIQRLPIAGEAFWISVQEDITQRKAADEALRESEEYNRQIITGLKEGLVVLDRDLRIRVWNKYNEQMTGVGAEQALGKTAGEVFPHSQLLEDARWIEMAMAGKSVVAPDLISHFPHATREVWMSRRLAPLRNARGEIVGVLWTTQDITERKRVEQALFESEARLQFALEAAKLGVWEFNLNDRSLYCSPTLLEIHGLGDEAQDLDRFIEMIHPDDLQAARALIKAAVQERGEFQLELRTCHHERGLLWIECTGRARLDETGKPSYLIGISHDITKRKNADATAHTWESVFEQAEFGLAVADSRTNAFTAVNQTFARQRGYAPDELIGAAVSEIYASDYHDQLLRVATQLETTGHATFESTHRRKDGSQFPVLMEVTGIKNQQGEIETRVSYALDITERKEAENAMQDYTARLEHIREVDEAILAAQSPAEIADAGLRHLARLMPCWTGAIAILEQDRDELTPVAATGLLSDWLALGTRISLLPGERDRMSDRRRGATRYVEDDVATRHPSALIESLRVAGLRSYLFVTFHHGSDLTGAIFLAADRPASYTDAHVEVVREVASHLAVAINQAMLLNEVTISQGRLESLSRQLLRAQEVERRHIARELHDEIGQALTALKINLQEIKRHGGDIAIRLAESEELVERSLQQVRGMALDLRPPLLDDLGLIAALRWFVRRQAERTGIPGRFVADPEEIRVHPEIETTCFRVAQEALTNVSRHAQASRFSIDLLQHAGGLQLVIRDNGVGFDIDAAFRASEEGVSMGLSGMRERVELVGGRIEFLADAGNGTEIQVELPLNPGAFQPSIG